MKKGNLAEGFTTFDIFVKCGYREEGKFKILLPEPEILIQYEIWESPRGNLGISYGALVSINGNKITYKWYKTGRLYGKPSHGITSIYADGKKEELDMLPDGLEAVEELKEEV